MKPDQTDEERAEEFEISRLPLLSDGSTVVHCLSEEQDIEATLKFTLKVIRGVSTVKGELFALGQVPVNDAPWRPTVTTLGLIQNGTLAPAVLQLIRLDFDEVRWHFPMHKFCPELVLLEKLVEDHKLRSLGLNWTSLDATDQGGYAFSLNAFVKDLKEQTATKKFRKLRKNFQRGASKNHRRLLEYLVSLMSRHGRIEVLRIDLSYRKPALWPRDTRSPVSYSEVKTHWTSMWDYLRSQFSLVGYAWKLEYGLHKGFHYHVLVLLDGSRHQRDIGLTKQIGENWVKDITGGRGLYWNCNAGKYAHRGVGTLSHLDSKKLKILLEKVAPYLTKADYVKQFVPPEGGRTFGTGFMPKERAIKRGRPRQAGGAPDADGPGDKN